MTNYKNDLELAKSYDFNIVEQLFEYILESYLNGNFAQTGKILNELEDIVIFIDWLDMQNFCKPLSLINMYFIYK